MTLETLRQASIYQNYLRPVIWAPIWAHRWNVKKTRDRHLRKISVEDTKLLAEARAASEHLYQPGTEPLVSITVCTYNRAKLLADVVLPAALAQTYRNIEVIVVGDCCSDETPELLKKIHDPRLTFVNLPERQKYPKNKLQQWKLSGLNAITRAQSMARGLWIAHLDDDDVYTPDHVEKLLSRAQAGGFEFVSGVCRIESQTGQWVDRGGLWRKVGDVIEGHISHSTILRRTYTKFFRADRCLETDLPGDTYVWHRMLNAGVRTGFADHIVTLQPLRPGEKERSLQYYFSQC